MTDNCSCGPTVFNSTTGEWGCEPPGPSDPKHNRDKQCFAQYIDSLDCTGCLGDSTMNHGGREVQGFGIGQPVPAQPPPMRPPAVKQSIPVPQLHCPPGHAWRRFNLAGSSIAGAFARSTNVDAAGWRYYQMPHGPLYAQYRNTGVYVGCVTTPPINYALLDGDLGAAPMAGSPWGTLTPQPAAPKAHPPAGQWVPFDRLGMPLPPDVARAAGRYTMDQLLSGVSFVTRDRQHWRVRDVHNQRHYWIWRTSSPNYSLLDGALGAAVGAITASAQWIETSGSEIPSQAIQSLQNALKGRPPQPNGVQATIRAPNGNFAVTIAPNGARRYYAQAGLRMLGAAVGTPDSWCLHCQTTCVDDPNCNCSRCETVCFSEPCATIPVVTQSAPLTPPSNMVETNGSGISQQAIQSVLDSLKGKPMAPNGVRATIRSLDGRTFLMTISPNGARRYYAQQGYLADLGAPVAEGWCERCTTNCYYNDICKCSECTTLCRQDPCASVPQVQTAVRRTTTPALLFPFHGTTTRAMSGWGLRVSRAGYTLPGFADEFGLAKKDIFASLTTDQQTWVALAMNTWVAASAYPCSAADFPTHPNTVAQCFQISFNLNKAANIEPLNTDGAFDEPTLCALIAWSNVPFPDPQGKFCKGPGGTATKKTNWVPWAVGGAAVVLVGGALVLANR